MKSFIKNINRILLVLGVVIILAALISLFFLNDAQRMVVGLGAALGIVNLLGLAYFFNKNAGGRRK